MFKSRSTWACELKFNRQRKNLCRHWSRSTWACELKFHDLRHISASVMVTLHVSVWVEIFIPMLVIQPNYVTLHVSVWVEIADRGKITPEQYGHAPRERVSWNLLSCFRPLLFNSHAPRERVSWNDFIGVLQIFFCVTLHVSVWVEMDKVDILRTTLQVTLHVSVWVEITYTRLTVKQRRSRSTWACELKFWSYGSG